MPRQGQAAESSAREAVPLPAADLGRLAEEFHRALPEPLRKRLNEMGVPDDVLKGLAIGYDVGPPIGFADPGTAVGGLLRRRLIFPIRDAKGRVSDLVGLALEPKERPLYKTARGGLDALFNEPVLAVSEIVFLCDSLMDALVLLGTGYPAMGVPGGGNFRAEWAPRFAGKDVFLCFENTETGRHHRERAAVALAGIAREVHALALPAGVGTLHELAARPGPFEERLAQMVAAAMAEGGIGRPATDARNLHLFYQEFTRRGEGKAAGLPTGLPALDELLLGGWRGGVHVLAGIPAVGKTTLLRQFADAAAAQGHPAIFISFEMSAFELWCKSMSRLTGLPAAAIAGGRVPRELVARTNEEYRRVAEDMWTVEGDDETTVEAMAEFVRHMANARGLVPAVFIDYLQRIPAQRQGTAAQDPEQRASAAILGLRRLSRALSCPVVVNYSMREEFAAGDGLTIFAENEEIEHTADVIMVLEAALGERPRTLAAVRECLAADPCGVELRVVKNRGGGLGLVPLAFGKSRGRFDPA